MGFAPDGVGVPLMGRIALPPLLCLLSITDTLRYCAIPFDEGEPEISPFHLRSQPRDTRVRLRASVMRPASKTKENKRSHFVENDH